MLILLLIFSLSTKFMSSFTRRNLFLGEGAVVMGRVFTGCPCPVNNHNSIETRTKQTHKNGF